MIGDADASSSGTTNVPEPLEPVAIIPASSNSDMISSSKGDIPQDIPDATPIAALPEISDVVIQPTDTDIIKAEISDTVPPVATAVILISDNQGEDDKMEVVASDVDKQTQVVINAADEVIPPQIEIASTKEVVIEESQEAIMGQDVIEQPSNEADSPINKSYHVRDRKSVV